MYIHWDFQIICDYVFIEQQGQKKGSTNRKQKSEKMIIIMLRVHVHVSSIDQCVCTCTFNGYHWLCTDGARHLSSAKESP